MIFSWKWLTGVAAFVSEMFSVVSVLIAAARIMHLEKENHDSMFQTDDKNWGKTMELWHPDKNYKYSLKKMTVKMNQHWTLEA